MRQRVIFGFFFFFFIAKMQAQDCGCAAQFQFLEEKVRLNYSGYRDKVTPKTQPDLDRHTALYRQATAAAVADTSCLRLLNEWKAWFRDGHLQVSFQAASLPPEKVRALYAGTEKIALSEAEARSYLDAGGRAPVEGVWQNAEGNYRAAITRQSGPQRDFAATILKADSVYWMPGQVKFELSALATPGVFAARFYMRDHSLRLDTAVLEQGVLAFKGLGAWYRLYPDPAPAKESVKRSVFRFEMLDSITALLTVPTMSERVRKELEYLVKENEASIKSAQHLIIDCRNNGGGSDITYYPLLPFIYTNPVKLYYPQVWATKDNAGKYAALHKNKDYPRITRFMAKRRERKMLRRQGELIGKKGTITVKRSSAGAYPLRVAVLINGGCASSCESFVEEARQSKKVTLIGVNSAGISDYGNLHEMPFPCPRFLLHYPTTRTSAIDAGKGIDNVGFPPDVRLGPEIKDWVAYARQYLHEKAKG